MSAAADTTSTTLPQNPFEAALAALIDRLTKLQAPKALATFPRPADFELVAEHIREAANIFDEWLAAIGGEVADNSYSVIDLRLFQGTFLGAVDGNATYACEEAGTDIRRMRRAS